MCVCLCVFVNTAAGPPGLSPASAASRAGSHRGSAEEVCSAGGRAEEVSDGQGETCTAAFRGDSFIEKSAQRVESIEIAQPTAAGCHNWTQTCGHKFMNKPFREAESELKYFCEPCGCSQQLLELCRSVFSLCRRCREKAEPALWQIIPASNLS